MFERFLKATLIHNDSRFTSCFPNKTGFPTNREMHCPNLAPSMTQRVEIPDRIFIQKGFEFLISRQDMI